MKEKTKKYTVRVYYESYRKYEVEGTSENDAAERAEEKLLDDVKEDANFTEVTGFQVDTN